VSEDVRFVCKLPHDDLPVVTRMFLRILDPQVYQGTLAFGDQFGSNPKKELRNANTSRRVLHLLRNEKLFLPERNWNRESQSIEPNYLCGTDDFGSKECWRERNAVVVVPFTQKCPSAGRWPVAAPSPLRARSQPGPSVTLP
jgi:hypothetical protein